MSFESYRKSAADSLTALPKSARSEKLAELQRTEEYWQARTEKLKAATQASQWSEDRVSLHWDTKNVYHGTDTRKIDQMKSAEESTIGNNAIYFTVDPALAMGYAKLRGKERKTGQEHLYEARLSDVSLMNWAEKQTVDKLKQEFSDYCLKAGDEMRALDYKDFSEKYGIWSHVEKSTVRWALKKIVEACDREDHLNGGNVKIIAQGVMGIFFEKFVLEKGYDGVITIEGGDDREFTAKPGVSVVLFNDKKIASKREFNIGSEVSENN